MDGEKHKFARGKALVCTWQSISLHVAKHKFRRGLRPSQNFVRGRIIHQRKYGGRGGCGQRKYGGRGGCGQRKYGDLRGLADLNPADGQS